MRVIFIVTLTLISLNAFAQKHKKSVENIADTALTPVVMHGFTGHKVLAINMGRKAIIYVSADSVLKSAKGLMASNFTKDWATKVFTFIDSAREVSDTIFADYWFGARTYLVGEQLKSGNAKVYYKREHSFADTIFIRLEIYGENGDRFYYFADERPFYMVAEYSGIIRQGETYPNNHRQEYLQEGNKLASLAAE